MNGLEPRRRASPRGRMAGVCHLLVILPEGMAAFARRGLIVAGDAAATGRLVPLPRTNGAACPSSALARQRTSLTRSTIAPQLKRDPLGSTAAC